MNGESLAYDDLSFPLKPSQPTTIPPHILNVYNVVNEALEAFGNELNPLIDSLIEDTNTALDVVEQDIVMVISGLIGDVDISLRAVEDDTTRKLNSIINSVYKTLAVAENDLVENGIGVPVATHDMAADLADESMDWLMQRIAGNSQPITPIITPDVATDDTHQCTTCADTSSVMPMTDETEPTPVVTVPPTSPLPPISPPSPPIPTTPVCGEWPQPLPVGWTARYRNNTTIGYWNEVDPRMEWVTKSEPPTTEENNYTQLLIDAHYTYAPPSASGGSTEPVYWWRPCTFASPPSPPPPPPPIDTTCPPACPIPVDVHVDVKYPDPPPVSPPAPLGTLSGIPAIPGTGSFWTQPDVCAKAVAGLTAPVPSDPTAPPVKPSDTTSVFTRLTDMYLPTMKPTRMVFDWIKSGFSTDEIKRVADSELTEFGKAASGLGPIASVVAGSLGLSAPNMPAALAIGTRIALAQKAEANTGFPVMYLAQNDWYLYQFANPQYLPTQSELNQAYSHNVIQSEQWRCLTMALGNQPEGMAWVIDAQQVRPIPSDIIGLYNRDIINRDKFYQMMREVGVLNQINSDYFYDLAKYVPPPTDLIQYMKRDVTDRTVVDQYNLDKDFDLKFNGIPGTPEYGKIGSWAKAQGMSPDTFLYEWRAHWQMPSNTALYEAQSRFRPDRPEYERFVAEHTAWVLGGTVGPEPTEPPVLHPADIQRALEVNDLMPAWVPVVMGLAYQPITRTDAVRAYEIGVFNDEQLYHAMRDNRYDDATSKTLLTFYKQQRERRVNNASGVWTIRKILKSYKEGGLTSDEAYALLAPLMFSPQQRQQALDAADTEVKAETKLRWIKVYRRGYFTGEHTRKGTETDLVNLGLDPKRVEDLLLQWDSDKMGRYREATVRQLMDWAVNNLISLVDLHNRLRTLGYSEIDAERIEYTAAHRQDKLVKAEIEKVVKDMEKRFKDQQQTKKATYDELTKRQKELQKEADRIQKELDKRKPPTP